MKGTVHFLPPVYLKSNLAWDKTTKLKANKSPCSICVALPSQSKPLLESLHVANIHSVELADRDEVQESKPQI